jgi:c-di-GMP-binding flagellar brake protein YcgR
MLPVAAMTNPPGHERRRYRRLKAPILIRPVSALASRVRQQVNDISLGGLRAYSDENQRPGARLELELLLPDDTSATVLAEVVWVTSLPEGAPARFDVGLRFVDARPDDLERIVRMLGDD